MPLSTALPSVTSRGVSGLLLSNGRHEELLTRNTKGSHSFVILLLAGRKDHLRVSTRQGIDWSLSKVDDKGQSNVKEVGDVSGV